MMAAVGSHHRSRVSMSQGGAVAQSATGTVLGKRTLVNYERGVIKKKINLIK